MPQKHELFSSPKAHQLGYMIVVVFKKKSGYYSSLVPANINFHASS